MHSAQKRALPKPVQRTGICKRSKQNVMYYKNQAAKKINELGYYKIKKKEKSTERNIIIYDFDEF